MRKYLILAVVCLFLMPSCKPLLDFQDRSNWTNIAITEDVDVFVDTTSIKPMGSVTYAYEKRVYKTFQAKDAYVQKIRDRYAEMGKPEKADRWADFSYNIYYSIYDCANQRFKILLVEDYDSQGNRIVRTTPPKDKLEWLNIESETLGDYTFFFVCDYGN